MSWETDILNGLGAPGSGNNVQKLDAWNACEGNKAGASGLPINNPFNTTYSGFGGVSVNSAGVKSYPNWASGLSATLATLRSSYYTAIVANLTGDGTGSQFAGAVGASPWGTSGSCIARVMGTVVGGGDPGGGGGGVGGSDVGNIGKAHTVFSVTTDPEFRPAPPVIVTSNQFPAGYKGQFTPVPTAAQLPQQQGEGIDLPYFFEWAFSNTGTFVYHGGWQGPLSTPPPTDPGYTAFLGIIGAIYDNNGNTGLTIADQTSPYVITTGSQQPVTLYPTYTQRFDYQLMAGAGLPQTNDDSVWYGECIYTWRSLQVVWTYLPVPPPPPIVRGKLTMGAQSLRPRVPFVSTTVPSTAVTLGVSGSGVPSAGGNLQFGPSSVRPR
jgi:hypothetical protein